jgi:hypothetical protein
MAVRVRLGQGPSVTDQDHDPSHPNGDLRAVGPTDRCDTRTAVSCGPRTTAWNLSLRTGLKLVVVGFVDDVPGVRTPRDVILGCHPGPKERPLLLCAAVVLIRSREIRCRLPRPVARVNNN